MKKTLAILLTLVLLLGVVGCATETTVEEPDVTPEATPVATDGGEESTEGVSGTFTGTASGMQGPVTVEMCRFVNEVLQRREGGKHLHRG